MLKKDLLFLFIYDEVERDLSLYLPSESFYHQSIDINDLKSYFVYPSLYFIKITKKQKKKERPTFLNYFSLWKQGFEEEMVKALTYFWGAMFSPRARRVPHYLKECYLRPNQNFFPRPSFWKAKDPMIIYGGTFNPWHLGHLACLNLLPEHLKRRVIILPDRNPFKRKEDQDLPIESDHPFQKFIKLREAAAGFPVYPGNFTREVERESNPTYLWAKKMRRPFMLLIGEDSFTSFPSWFKAKRLVKLKLFCGLYVVPRTEKRELVEKVYGWFQENRLDLVELPKFKIKFLADHPYRELSSTKIRNNLFPTLIFSITVFFNYYRFSSFC